MKIWVDDIRPAPEGYVGFRTVNEAMQAIIDYEIMYNASGGKFYYKIELIDLDHDAGVYVTEGGDYIEILNWLERTGRNYPIRIHSMNPVGRGNMRRIIRKNGWTEID